MNDSLTPAQRSYTMSRVRSKDTKPEIEVRKIVHGMGYRYRLHRKDLPGKPDMTFPRLKKVIFINGCFWHGHTCKQGKKRAKTNKEYWKNKISGNKKRDIANHKKLKELGWDVLVIWECEIHDEESIRISIKKYLG